MQQGNNLKLLKEQQRAEMRARISAEIEEMRSQQITITKKSLAESLGITERNMYTPYIKAFLLNFPEFNKGLKSDVSSEQISELQNEIKALKVKNKELQVSNRELRLDLKATKMKLKESEDRYEHLLGRYQQDVSEKIIHF